MTNLTRRHTLTVIGAGLMTARGALAASPADAINQRLARAEQDGQVSGLHTLLVSHAGALVVEHYQPGEDQSWGEPLGTVTFAPNVLHDLRSVSKCVVGLLYGIALADGQVPAPEARLYDHSPNTPIWQASPAATGSPCTTPSA